MARKRKKSFNRTNRIHLIDIINTCENSKYLFSKIKKFLEENRYSLTTELEDSDVVIINTCIVFDKIKNERNLLISRLINKYPLKNFIIFGCIVNSENKFTKNNVCYINSQLIDKFSDFFKNDLPISSIHITKLSFDQPAYQTRIDNHDNFIQISQGCVNNCSYCNIKLAKGTVKSRPVSYIKKEVLNLIKNRQYEITLLSDDCGSYGLDIGTDIAELVIQLSLLSKNLKFKIFSMHPSLLLKYYKKMKNFFITERIIYLGIMVQSGSNRILKLMNRKYDIREIKTLIKEIRNINKSIHLFTHFIINFPSESLRDFKASLNLASMFDFCLFLPYNENSNTLAARINRKCSQEDLNIKTKLVNQLIKSGVINGRVVENKP